MESEYSYAFLGEHDAVNAYQIMRDAQPHAWSFATFTSCLSHPYQAVGMHVRGVLSGFYIVHQVVTPQHNEWSLMEIAIAPAMQGQGLGKRLLDECVERAQQSSIDEIWLEVRVSNTVAIHVYQQAGFTHVDTRKHYYPAEHGREDGWVMCRYQGTRRSI